MIFETFKPGDIAPKDGWYAITNEQGFNVDGIKMKKGEKFPPLRNKNHHYTD